VHPTEVRNRLYNSAGFFMLIWAVHYFPFFLMNRQLFIHHYLPSHLASALVAGSVLSFVLSETINYPISKRGPGTHLRPRQFADLGIKGPVVVGVFVFFMFLMFVFMAPLTYGNPGCVLSVDPMLVLLTLPPYDCRLEGQQVNNRRLLSSWTLHFAAKESHEL
jgi:dolichyl-phosphate-mannose-protein mannosyltransferase